MIKSTDKIEVVKAKFRQGFIVIGNQSVSARQVVEVVDDVHSTTITDVTGKKYVTTTRASDIRKYCDRVNRKVDWLFLTH